MTERDDATGLDHTWWRKYENTAGRWTSPDPYLGSMRAGNPQSFNRYGYVSNDPVNFVDPSGLERQCITIRHENGRLETICFDTMDAVQIYPSWDNLPGLNGPRNTIPMLAPLTVSGNSTSNGVPRHVSMAPTIQNVKRDADARRARSLSDCLTQASDDYEKLKQQNAADYVNSMYGIQPSAIHSILALTFRSLGGSLGGFAVSLGVSTAYYAPGAVANKRAHKRARNSCYSFYGPR